MKNYERRPSGVEASRATVLTPKTSKDCSHSSPQKSARRPSSSPSSIPFDPPELEPEPNSAILLEAKEILAKRRACEPLEEKLEAAVDVLMAVSEGHVDALVKVIEESCGQDYILIGDNLDFLLKKTLSSKTNKNKMMHWFHLIGLCVMLSVL